ncbi:hypothetical protein [Streptomyces sp. 136MFCol5.1]|uniref:hypothetical protein n=1 Tax=Streptomyces sp. 136MFCol5.1 TaxID=1172182 RepID=UPI001C40B01F|nr:hypothetical protein [Streptomyces sp. 136MFCol5.1]
MDNAHAVDNAVTHPRPTRLAEPRLEPGRDQDLTGTKTGLAGRSQDRAGVRTGPAP